MNEIEPLSPQLKSAGRWATVASFLGALCLLVGAAFAAQYARRLGIPTAITYGLAGLGAVNILMINLGMSGTLSKAAYNVNITIYLIVMAIMTILGSIHAYVDDTRPLAFVGEKLIEQASTPISGQGLAAITFFIILFVLTAGAVWRLKISIDRNSTD